MPETMNHDGYCLDDENFDGNDEQLDGLKERLQTYRDAANLVVATWSQGDLAASVRGLAAVIESSIDLPAGFYESKAGRIGFQPTQTSHGERWTMEGDDGPGHETAKDAVLASERQNAA